MTRQLRSLLLLIFVLIFGLPMQSQGQDFTMSPTSGCVPLAVTFTDAGGSPGAQWNVGFGPTLTGATVNAQYFAPGVYTVTMTVNGNSVSKTLTVYPKPKPSFSAANTSGCAPFKATFTATGGSTYEWDFGDGSTGTGAAVDHVYSNPGTYSIRLRAISANNCDTAISVTNYITAYDKPTASIGANTTTICQAPALVNFTNTSYNGKGPYTAEWSFGDNSAAQTGNTPSHTYAASGYYDVRMIVTDANGCKDTSLNPNYIGVILQAATFTAPIKACENELLTFTNTTTGAVSETKWNFGDGSPAGDGAVTQYVYSAAGTYTIRMDTKVAGCPKTAPTQTIIVYPSPSVTISQFPPIPCPAPVQIRFTANSTRPGFSVASYNWSTTNGPKPTGTNQILTDTFLTNGRHLVKLQLISTDGCRDSAFTDTVFVRKLITNVTPGGFCPGIDTIAGCDPLDATFGVELHTPVLPPAGGQCVFQPYPANVISYRYDFGDGSGPDTRAAPSHRFTPSGNYKVTCVITTSNGCVDSGYRPVHVDTPVAPSFYASPLTSCPKQPITIYNTTANPLPGTRYLIDINADTTFTSDKLGPYIVGIKRFGTYTVRILSNHFGCVDSMIRQRYIKVNPPFAKFSDSIFCAPNLGVKFTNLSDSATSYRWFFGDGNESTATDPTHFYAAKGDYKVKLVAYNIYYDCTDTFVKDVFIIKPDITFSADVTKLCKKDPVRFTAQAATTHTVRYGWEFDNIRTAADTGATIEWNFQTIGYHTVTLYAESGNNCEDVITRKDYILVSGPSAAFTSTPHVGCEPLLVQFNDQTTNLPGMPAKSKIWVLGNGDSIKNNLSNTPSYTYLNKGFYDVKFYITDTLGCIDSQIRNKYIEVYKPTAAFIQSTDVVCKNTAMRFTSFSIGKAPLRYNWDFGDNISYTTTRADTTHVFTKTGKYRVRLIVIDSVGCRDTMISGNEIAVNAPTAAFTMSDSVIICSQPIQIQFANQSSPDATGFYWSFGDGSSGSTLRDPVRTFANAGLFSIYLMARDANGCTDTARRQVRKLGYAGALTYTPTLGCAPMEVTFSTPISGIPRLIWDYGDGSKFDTTYNSAPTTHIYTSAQPTPYTPRVIFDDLKGCNTPSEGTDPIQVDQLTSNFNWSVPCEGVDFTLTEAATSYFSPANDFTWAFTGSSTPATGRTVQQNYPRSGTYQVTLTARNPAGCTASVTKDVFVHPSPDLNAMVDTAICPADTAHLRAENAVSYTWSPAPQNAGAWLSCTACQDPFAYAGGPAVYLVTATDEYGCIGHDSTRVKIQIKTTSSTGDGGDICLGESFKLNASGAQKYEWIPAASVDDPYSPTPLATPKTTTTYIVAAQEGTCLVDSQRVTVVVHSAPDFTAGPDKIITLGSATTLEAKGNFSKITWLYNDTTLSCHDCPNPNAHPYYTRSYVATAENEWGCKTTDSVTVIVRCNGSLIFLPNTFTPNGDGQNDYFYPQGAGFDRLIAFRVYNRWGELVFETRNTLLNDERAGWDGSFKGERLAPDTYVYAITGRCPTGELMEFKGDVTLIR
jgi:gliding motility-associated-like protein